MFMIYKGYKDIVYLARKGDIIYQMNAAFWQQLSQKNSIKVSSRES